ncbi:MAG: hypothetical protein IIB54_01930 [Planctomycetes bacterium]|nr:hypothetical protein [Planctomycetota bacterium]
MSKKGNSFFTSLEGNIRAASHAALVKSVVADPHQTIGQILDSLAEQEEAKYLLEAFKDMSIGQILEGAVNLARTMEPDSDAIITDDPPAPTRPSPVKASTPKNGVSKKVAPPRATNGKSNGASSMDLSSPDRLKAYEASIIKTLKGGNHVDEDSGISSSDLRKVVGGATDQARNMLDALISNGRVNYYGKARGTKYYLFA